MKLNKQAVIILSNIYYTRWLDKATELRTSEKKKRKQVLELVCRGEMWLMRRKEKKMVEIGLGKNIWTVMQLAGNNQQSKFQLQTESSLESFIFYKWKYHAIFYSAEGSIAIAGVLGSCNSPY